MWVEVEIDCGCKAEIANVKPLWWFWYVENCEAETASGISLFGWIARRNIERAAKRLFCENAADYLPLSLEEYQ